MDITLTKILHSLIGLFMPLWIIAVATALFCAFLSKRGVLNAAKYKALGRVFAAVMLSFMLACICSWLLQRYFASKKLRSFAADRPQSLILRAGAMRVEIKDPAAINSLLSLICQGRKVSAHHTHPVDKIELLLPAAGYTYSLGKDSQVKDEFWLDWISYPGSDPGISSIMTVRQFRSPELSARLEQYVARGEPGGPANGSQPIRSETNSTASAAGPHR